MAGAGGAGAGDGCAKGSPPANGSDTTGAGAARDDAAGAGCAALLKAPNTSDASVASCGCGACAGATPALNGSDVSAAGGCRCDVAAVVWAGSAASGVGAVAFGAAVCRAASAALVSRNLASLGGGGGSAKVAAEVGPRRSVATGAGRAPPFAAVSITPEWRWCFCQIAACSASTSDTCAHTSSGDARSSTVSQVNGVIQHGHAEHQTNQHADTAPPWPRTWSSYGPPFISSRMTSTARFRT